MKKWLLFLFLIANPLIFPTPVSAHAFGKLYNLPVPFWMYLYGGAAAIVASFLIIGYFFNRPNKTLSYPTISLSTKFDFLIKSWFINTLKILSVSLFIFTILTGLIGEDSSYSNFNMTFFWIIFLLGLTYTTALIGNVWAFINPWKVLIEWGEKLLGEKARGLSMYPKKLGYYPALLFYFLFIFIELLSQPTPSKLSFLLIFYSLINFIGVFWIGRDNWFQYCEFFSVFFRLISKIAPIEYTKGKLYLRPPLVGLLKGQAEHFSLVIFILFMLSSTAFDGFRSTIVFYRFYWQNLSDPLSAILGSGAYPIFETVGLVISPLVFLIIYLALILLAKIITKSHKSIKELALEFAFSLIPIALVYNIAHYYTLLLTQGQDIIRLISDPFGFGWNLFDTTNFSPNIAVIDAGITWHVQVAIILIGHIAGVYLAHSIALKVFPSHKKALVSQLPMLVLMVTYTMIGLWILAQPITGGTL